MAGEHSVLRYSASLAEQLAQGLINSCLTGVSRQQQTQDIRAGPRHSSTIVSCSKCVAQDGSYLAATQVI